MSSAAKMLLNDFQRGKLPHYMKPPGWTEKDDEEAAKIEEAEKQKASEETKETDQTEELTNEDEPKTSTADWYVDNTFLII